MRWMNAAVSAAASSIRAEATRRSRTASRQTVGGVIQSVTALSRFTAGSLRDAARGKAVSVPSKRDTAFWGISQLAPAGLVSRVAARGR